MVIKHRIAGREPFGFGQLRVSFEGGTAVISGPEAPGEASEVEGSPQAIRAWVREDDRGRYRPLAGAATMRHGWHARCRAAELTALLEEIYPLGQRHLEQFERADLRVVALDEVLSRQTGRYRVASALKDAGRRRASEVLCARCVKAPAWRGDEPAIDQIPCPEPCSVLVALCREAALWQENPPRRAETNPNVPFAAFDVPGNEVRERFLGAR